MISLRFIDPYTCKCKKTKSPKAGDLLEVRFVHANNREKRFKLDGFLHYDGPYKVDSPELNIMEKKQWLLGILHDELARFVASKENAADYRLSYLYQFGEETLLPESPREAVVLTLDNFSKVHIVHPFTDMRNSIDFTLAPNYYDNLLKKAGLSNSHDDNNYGQCSFDEQEKNEVTFDFDLRIHLPILWNETLQMWNVYRHGDICRVRFVYSKDLEWYNNHLEGFVEHIKNFPLWH